MSKAIFWCSSCAVPIIENSICPRCGSACKETKRIVGAIRELGAGAVPTTPNGLLC